MFVRQSKYDEEVEQRLQWQVAHTLLQSKWNSLVTRINKLGGEDFLQNATMHPSAVSQQFSDDELRSLLQLVHPDKHDGKESAVRLTQKINALRKK